MLSLCRFTSRVNPWPSPGWILDETTILDLASAGVGTLTEILEKPDPEAFVRRLARGPLRPVDRKAARLLAPVDRQEIWAAGVTYLRSKTARMEESDFSATAYDRVYSADRPELFFKSIADKAVGPLAPVGIRADAKWNVPEPELALVLNSRAEVIGFTAGNDMSSRDIEGENLLYLPQAKVYKGSCALGPAITVGVTEAQAREWTIGVTIERAGAEVFKGSTSVAQIKRTFPELAGWLARSQEFPHGAVLLTGTGVVPPNEFTLAAGDRITVSISGVGALTNEVAVV
jgi:2-dehydro-3-deoxy-D-arabinonate dehydratase